jgi:TPR repeat protein
MDACHKTIRAVFAGWLVCWSMAGVADDFSDGLRYAMDKDDVHAAACFKKAAAKNNVPAQFQLALMYAEGRGVAQSYQQAAFWFESAAELGDAMAQFKLGKQMADGIGVPRDLVEAYKWTSLAAENNVRPARALLNTLNGMLNSTQLAEAHKRVDAWHQAHGN